jgi:hypothetical protein
MVYQSDEIGVAQMFDELVAKGHTRFEAARELGQALKDGMIILNYAGAVVGPTDLIAIRNYLLDFVADPASVRIGFGSLVPIMNGATASRAEFETRCDLVEQPIEREKANTKGPTPGTVDRYGISDRARFPEIEVLMKGGKSLTAATNELGPTLEGPATDESKARRLRDLFNKWKASN